MFLRGKCSRSLVWCGMFGMAGIGLLLPATVSWADPPEEEFVQFGEKKRSSKSREPAQMGREEMLEKVAAEIDRLHAETEQMRAELEKRRMQMEKRTEEMLRTVERLRRLAASTAEQPKSKPAPAPKFDDKRHGSVEKRIEKVEHTLEVLMKEMRELRHDLKEAIKSKEPPATPKAPPMPPATSKTPAPPITQVSQTPHVNISNSIVVQQPAQPAVQPPAQPPVLVVPYYVPNYYYYRYPSYLPQFPSPY